MIQSAWAARGATAVANSLFSSLLFVALVSPAPLSAAARESHRSADGLLADSPAPADNGHVFTPGAANAVRDGGTATLWVYFTDKGETDATSLARAIADAAAHVPGSSRARRAKLTNGRLFLGRHPC